MSTVSAITLGKQEREQAIQKTTAVEQVVQESVHRIVCISEFFFLPSLPDRKRWQAERAFQVLVLTHVTQANKATITPFLTMLRNTNMAVVISSERRMGYLQMTVALIWYWKARQGVHLASASQILLPPLVGDLTSQISLA